MKIFQKYILISFMLTMSIATGCPHDKDSIINIETQDGLQNLLTKSQGPIAIFFHMKGCHWCEKTEPVINEIAADPRFNNICFYRADARGLTAAQGKPSVATPNLVRQATGQDIPGYPFILFMNQGKYINKQIGGITEEGLINKIENAFPDAMNHNITEKNCDCAQQ